MIPLDWKERLEKDTADFFLNKLPKNDYDFDLIYNAYPKRIDNQVPKPVVTYVAKDLAGKLAKEPKQYTDFYQYLWDKKGEAGKLAVSVILNRVAKKDNHFFLEFVQEKLLKEADEHAISLLLDKVVLPIAKTNPSLYLDFYCQLLSDSRYYVKLAAVKMLVKIAKVDKTILKSIQMFMENRWFTATSEEIKLNIQWLKAVHSVDEDYYLSIFHSYKTTRDSIVAEILSHSIRCYDTVIEEMVERWSKSGNAKLKKNGIAGQKAIKKLKK